MRFAVNAANPVKARTHCLILGVFAGNRLSPPAEDVNTASDGLISRILKRGDITGKAGQTLLLHDVSGIRSQRVLLAGLGDAESLDAARFSLVIRAVVSAIKATNAENVTLCLGGLEVRGRGEGWPARRIAETFVASFYAFDAMREKPAKTLTPGIVTLNLPERARHPALAGAASIGAAIGAGMNRARDLGNHPGNICTPTFMADACLALADEFPAVKTDVLNEDEMQDLGMGALLSVGNGSVEPSKLVVMHYNGGNDDAAPHIIVGKGISFDTGGISLKPAGSMPDMIYDMCGAASVLGTIAAIATMELNLNVLGVIAAAENMPSGTATRPGDIITSLSGQTIEILNTDAEGRLVLCDALTYIDRFKPVTVVDIATLTGAAVVALGSHATALYANDDALAEGLHAAGEAAQDRAWRMPLWDDYQVQLKSAFADMSNTGGRAAGSITAACFLSRFTREYRWAHLDVAGTAYRGGSAQQKGATGRPVPLLTQYLMDQAVMQKA